jgi:hypothetical protein
VYSQIIAGLAHMHSLHLLHRDMHTGNVLVKKKTEGDRGEPPRRGAKLSVLEFSNPPPPHPRPGSAAHACPAVNVSFGFNDGLTRVVACSAACSFCNGGPCFCDFVPRVIGLATPVGGFRHGRFVPSF